MGMKPGYKQSEVGVIPEEWHTRKIREIGEVRGRVGWKGYTKKDLVPLGPFAIGAKHIDKQCGLDLSEPTYLSKAKYLESPEIMVQTGDILVVQRGTIGKLVLIEEDIGEATINPSLVIVRTTNSSPSFIRYFLLSSQGQKQIILDTSTTGVPMISQRQIENFRIPFPPTVEEQRSVAQALSDVDALLGALDQFIAKKRDLKQAAMQQLLTGQKRLPGFATTNPRLKQTDVGMIPNDWEVSTVGQEFDIQLGKMLDAEKNTGALKPYLGNRAVQWERIDTCELPVIAISRADVERFRLRQGDLLVCEGGEVGRAAVWNSPLEECYFQKALHRLRPRRGFNSRLMIAFLRLWSERGLLLNYVTQTSIAHLPKDKFVTVPLPVPTRVEQTAIAEVLSDMDTDLAGLEQRRDKTRAIKQGMMQELLTGRTRLV